jgi:hypothetical protein
VVWKRDQAFAKKHNPKATWIEKITLPRAIKKASRIIAVSQSTKNDIQHFFKTSQGKIAVIGCAAGDVYRHWWMSFLGIQNIPVWSRY